MNKLSKEQIKSIAEDLECGLCCHIHKETNDFIILPNEDNFGDMDMEPWEKDPEKIEENPDQYISIAPPRSRDSFTIMAEFVDSITDNEKLQERLIRALSKRKPFSHFKYEIDNSGEYREKWFAFKSQKFQEWVESEISFHLEEDLDEDDETFP